jgi:hypothetical protein
VVDNGNQTIHRIAPDGQFLPTLEVLAGAGPSTVKAKGARLDRPTAIPVDGAGTFYVPISEDNLIWKVSPAGLVSRINAHPFIDARGP